MSPTIPSSGARAHDPEIYSSAPGSTTALEGASMAVPVDGSRCSPVFDVEIRTSALAPRWLTTAEAMAADAYGWS